MIIINLCLSLYQVNREDSIVTPSPHIKDPVIILQPLLALSIHFNLKFDHKPYSPVQNMAFLLMHMYIP